MPLPDESKGSSASSLISFFSAKINETTPPLRPTSAFASTYTKPPHSSVAQIAKEREKDRDEMLKFRSAGGSQGKLEKPLPLKNGDFVSNQVGKVEQVEKILESTRDEQLNLEKSATKLSQPPSPPLIPIVVPISETPALSITTTPIEPSPPIEMESPIVPSVKSPTPSVISPSTPSMSPEPTRIRSRTTASSLAKTGSPRLSTPVRTTRNSSPSTVRTSIDSIGMSRSSSATSNLSISNQSNGKVKVGVKKVVASTGTPRSRAAAAKLLEDQDKIKTPETEKKPFLTKGIGKVGLGGAGRVKSTPPSSPQLGRD